MLRGAVCLSGVVLLLSTSLALAVQHNASTVGIDFQSKTNGPMQDMHLYAIDVSCTQKRPLVDPLDQHHLSPTNISQLVRWSISGHKQQQLGPMVARNYPTAPRSLFQPSPLTRKREATSTPRVATDLMSRVVKRYISLPQLIITKNIKHQSLAGLFGPACRLFSHFTQCLNRSLCHQMSLPRLETSKP